MYGLIAVCLEFRMNSGGSKKRVMVHAEQGTESQSKWTAVRMVAGKRSVSWERGADCGI